ncbi:MAG: bifunctional folylpolyglutamate synthase/dihydrofolate synthase, partial [Acetobacteraceae bacterium]
VVTGEQAPEAVSVIADVARQNQAPLFARGGTWQLTSLGEKFRFQDQMGALELPTPALPGSHQFDNAGIALAALGAAGIAAPESAYAAGLTAAVWPARLQCLTGRLARRLPPGFSLWVDGGHNPGAGAALAAHLAGWRAAPVHLVVGMKTGKDSVGFLAPLLPLATSLYAVSEPGQHFARPVSDIIAASGGIARPGPTVASALAQIGRDQPPGRVLICGSLYLAGEVLKQDGDWPQ